MSFLKRNLLQRKVLLFLCCFIFLVLTGWMAVGLWGQSPHIGVVGIDELWRMRYDGKVLDGNIVTVSGDAIGDPYSDFRFNGLYLVDSQTPNHLREPAYGFWFGVGIPECKCKIGKEKMTCQPFDPTRATAFEFKGTLNSEQIGKKAIMWLSDIDFEESRQLIDGSWQSIPIGVFEIPIATK